MVAALLATMPTPAFSTRATPQHVPPVAGPYGVVAIGASWGGLHAIGRVLRQMPDAMTAPILVVQHRAADAESILAELLQDVTARPVRDATHDERSRAGHVYLAPPDRHLLLDRAGRLHLSSAARVRFSRPSVDATFLSVAAAQGRGAVAVVLTGANDDGARGAARILERGGRVVVQEPASAEVLTMPEAAVRRLARVDGAGDRWCVRPLDGVADAIAEAVTHTAEDTERPGGSPGHDC